MTISLAQSFVSSAYSVPAALRRSAVAISPRFPRDGVSAAGPASGTTGTAGTIVPARSVTAALTWGATVALWSYTDLAASYGYASPAAFISEFTAAGIPIGGTTNTRAVNASTGPFMKDLGGSSWSAGSNPDRPALTVGQPNPLKSRISVSIDYMPAGDVTNTWTPKLATIASQIAAGCSYLHMDDPRGGAAYSGWAGAVSAYDLTSQGVDFSTTAKAAFTTWLSTNTTSSQRTAVGLPASLAGFDIETWLVANYGSSPNILYSPNQVNASAIDNYLFRTSISNYEALRTILLKWMGKFLRDDHAAYVAQVRSTLAGAPLSLNFWNAAPSEFLSWHVRTGSQLWDFAVAETAPPYWSQLSAYTVGSESFIDARMNQCARQHLNAVMCDYARLRTFMEHKPTALNQAPARVVKQLLRQSIMQSVMEGIAQVVPIDVFMTTNDGEYDQGVDVDGYRFFGNAADYLDCFTFIRANASLIDDFERLATVHVAVHNDTWPFHSGGTATRFQTLMSRLAELWRRDVDYHLLPVGNRDGLLPQDPVRAVETTAPLIIRIQDDAEYYDALGRLAGPRCRRWSARVADEASGYSPVRSTNRNVRATARYNAATRTVAVHLLNYAVNSDGTPNPQTTTVLWNWDRPMSNGAVVRLGESGGTVEIGASVVTLTEYAIVSFQV